jgi:hypothetical protein
MAIAESITRERSLVSGDLQFFCELQITKDKIDVAQEKIQIKLSFNINSCT